MPNRGSLKTALIKALVSREEARHEALMRSAPPPVVVLGFPRSGTSLIGQLVAAAGYHFGQSPYDLKPDARNPRGYFEYSPLFELSRVFLREAGVMSELDPAPQGLRARGFLNRLKRAFTRRAMIRTLDALAEHPPFALKLFPRFYYFWKNYLPKSTKIIAIYREPEAVAHSFMAAWPGGGYTIDRILQFWSEHNRDLLFHLSSTSSSLLIKYEDLLDTATRHRILASLARFLEVDTERLDGVIDPMLNRSAHVTASGIPLPPNVRETLAALDAKRV